MVIQLTHHKLLKHPYHLRAANERNPYIATKWLVSFHIFEKERWGEFHWHSNIISHITITLNILNIFITFISLALVRACSGHRDYHPGGKSQSRLRSQVAVTFSHSPVECCPLLCIRKNQTYVSARAVEPSGGYWPSRVQSPCLLRGQIAGQLTCYHNVHHVPTNQSDVQMSRCIRELCNLCSVRLQKY